jgi:ABC-type transport system involved in multi-copper enzyme maturation permease subunit
MKRISSNPILQNEFRYRMRNKRVPWVVSFYLGILGALVFTFMWMDIGDLTLVQPQRAKEIFALLSLFQYILIGFVTPGLTAGLISGERERQTLPLLLTTTTSPAAIILGKWVSSLSFICILVFTTAPMYAIMLLYGGISPSQFMQVFLLYIISIFAIGALGIFMSTVIKRTGVATVVTYAVIFAYIVGTLVAIVVLNHLRWRVGTSADNSGGFSPGYDMMEALNPFYIFFMLFDVRVKQLTLFGIELSAYGFFLTFFAVITILLLVLAIYFLQPVRRRLK